MAENTNSLQTKILKKVNLTNASILLVVTVLFYLIAKTIYFKVHENCPFGEAVHETWISIWHHMDFWGYFIGMIAIIVGAFIAKIADEGMKSELREMKETERQIMLATDDLKANATQRTILKFPELFEEIKIILNSINGEGGKLFIMNKTSSFGRIHTFNKKFSIQFNEDNLATTTDDDKFLLGIKNFNEQIVLIERLVEDCFSKNKNVKLVTSNDTLIESDLIAKYFISENSQTDINAGKGLKYYTWNNEGKIVFETLDKVQTENKIKEFVKKHHTDTLKKLSEIRVEKGFNDVATSIIQETEASKIPMQMYLVEFLKGGSKFNRTLVIFAVDQEVDANNVDRVLIGIASSSNQIFNVFKTFFDN